MASHGHGGASKEADAEVLQFSLTDPESLSEQLEAANLNEEETDILLSEALKLNAQLKEALKFQQLEEATHNGKVKTKKGSPKHHGHPLAAPMAPRNPRPSNLPPIVTPTNKTKPSNLSRSGSASGSKRKGSEKKATPKKPEWDDRFSYN